MDRVIVLVVQVHVPQGHVVEKTIRHMTVEKIVEIPRCRRPAWYPDCRECEPLRARQVAAVETVEVAETGAAANRLVVIKRVGVPWTLLIREKNEVCLEESAWPNHRSDCDGSGYRLETPASGRLFSSEGVVECKWLEFGDHGRTCEGNGQGGGTGGAR